MEVEDIMCDQSILYPDGNVQFDSKVSYLVIPASKLWVVIELIARSIVPPLSTICYTVFRNPQIVFQNVRHQIVPAVVAFVVNNVSRSLASVQSISLPVTLRITQDKDGHNRAVISDGGDDTESETSEKSVECLVLFEPEEIGIDVIFLHGLHGGINKTWKQGTWRTSKHKLSNQLPVRRQSTGNLYFPPKDHALKRTLSNIYSKVPRKIAKCDENEGSLENKDCDEDDIKNISDYSDCWPRDWIPKDCPNARVIALDYTTDVLWCPTWMKKRKRTNLIERSNEMIEELIKIGVGEKPIMWVGHSKGGLYIKQMMLNAFENIENRVEVENIFKQSKAIMWYSVPHRGSTLANGTLPLLRRSVELLEIQRNCNFVLDLHKKFLKLVEEEKQTMDIFSFIETSFTLMSFMYLKIVAYESADANIGIKCDVPLDHREICKPAARDCFLYLELVKLIKKYCEK